MDDSPGRLDTVLDDGDFLLQLAEECAQERLEAKGLVEPVLVQHPSHAAAGASQSMQGHGRRKERSTETHTGAQPPAALQSAPRSLQHSMPGLATPSVEAAGFYVEPLSGLRVTRPVVGSVIVRERLSDRPFVKLGAIKQMAGSAPPANDWATVAVLVSKVQLEARTGGTYSKWQLTDLNDASACLFLFGAAHRDLYKECEGSVIILYGAKVSQQQGGGWSLRVDQPEQVSRIGHSPDLAYCRGTKADGNPCRHVVNRNKCEYCPFHAARALKQLQLRRPDLRGRNMLEAHLRPTALKAEQSRRHSSAGVAPQPLLSGRQLSDKANNLRAQTVAGSRAAASTGAGQNLDHASQASASVTTVGLKRSRGLDAVLAIADADIAAAGGQAGQSTPSVQHGSRRSGSQQRNRLPPCIAMHTGSTPPDEAELELGGSDDENQEPAGVTLTGPKARLLEFVKSQRTAPEHSSTAASQVHAISSRGQGASNRTSHVSSAMPSVARQHVAGPIAAAQQSPLMPISSRLNIASNTGRGVGAPATSHAATQKASKDPQKAKMLASLGLAKHNSQSSTKAAGTAAAMQTGHQQQQKQHTNGGAVRSAAVTAAAKAAAAAVMVAAAPNGAPVSAMAAAFGAIARQALQGGQGEKEPESRYHELCEELGWQELLGHLDQMDKKDTLQQQLDSVKSLKVSVFHCSDCNVFSEYKRKECLEARHNIVRAQTTKRFWQCTHCNARSSSLGVIYPKRRCPRCNDPGMDFKPTTMYAGPHGNTPAAEGQGIAAKENLLPRGTEHSFAVTN